MFKRILVLISFLICLTGSAAAAGPITLATGEFAPYTSDTMEGKGIFTEIVTAVLAEMGKTPVYKFYPWKRCESAVATNKAWAAFPYVITEERSKTFMFTDVVLPSREMFFFYGDRMDGVTWETLGDLKSYKIGGTIGYHYEKTFKAAGLNVDYNPKEIASVKKLKAGRVDLVPMDEAVGRQHIKSAFPEATGDFKTLAKPNSETPLRLMVNKNAPDAVALVEKFNTALAAIKSNGTYQSILQKYGMTR